MNEVVQPKHVKALFISDVHLGMKTIRVEQLLDFLRAYDAETIYLVGDIIDGWRLQKTWRWPTTYNLLLQKILRKARKGARA